MTRPRTHTRRLQLPAAAPQSPQRVETRRGSNPWLDHPHPAHPADNTIAGRGLTREIHGHRYTHPTPAHRDPDRWRPVVWAAILLTGIATGIVLTEFALRPLLGLLIDAATALHLAAPH